MNRLKRIAVAFLLLFGFVGLASCETEDEPQDDAEKVELPARIPQAPVGGKFGDYEFLEDRCVTGDETIYGHYEYFQVGRILDGLGRYNGNSYTDVADDIRWFFIEDSDLSGRFIGFFEGDARFADMTTGRVLRRDVPGRHPIRKSLAFRLLRGLR